MGAQAPFVAGEATVEDAWIDYNGHLNMAWYNVLFDRAADEAFETLGLTPESVRRDRFSFYAVETHVCYLRELHKGGRVRASFHLLDHDEKRLHVYSELVHAEGWTAATSETLYLHIDARGPKAAPMQEAVLNRVRAMRSAHAGLTWPVRAGRRIALARRAGA